MTKCSFTQLTIPIGMHGEVEQAHVIVSGSLVLFFWFCFTQVSMRGCVPWSVSTVGRAQMKERANQHSGRVINDVTFVLVTAKNSQATRGIHNNACLTYLFAEKALVSSS